MTAARRSVAYNFQCASWRAADERRSAVVYGHVIRRLFDHVVVGPARTAGNSAPGVRAAEGRRNTASITGSADPSRARRCRGKAGAAVPAAGRPGRRRHAGYRSLQ